MFCTHGEKETTERVNRRVWTRKKKREQKARLFNLIVSEVKGQIWKVQKAKPDQPTSIPTQPMCGESEQVRSGTDKTLKENEIEWKHQHSKTMVKRTYVVCAGVWKVSSAYSISGTNFIKRLLFIQAYLPSHCFHGGLYFDLNSLPFLSHKHIQITTKDFSQIDKIQNWSGCLLT